MPVARPYGRAWSERLGCSGLRGTAAKWLAGYWREALLVTSSVLLSYVILEIGYRTYHYRTLAERLVATVTAQVPAGSHAQSQYKYDPHTGFLYTANFEGRLGPPWNSQWRTNSHGHVSQFEYSKFKPAGEYRIAVLGDSLTSGVTGNVRWTEILEQHMNASPQWQRAVGNRFTRVINFGVSGMGMVQFAPMLRHHAMEFDPDLVIVNFITDDVLRRLTYVDPPQVAATGDEAVRHYVRTNFIDSIKWFRIYPELFAATIGRLWNMRTALPLDHRSLLAAKIDIRYPRRQDAIEASAAAIRDMLSLAPAILFLQTPQLDELEEFPKAYRMPEWAGLMVDLKRAVPNLTVVSMQPQMEALLEGKRMRHRPDLAGMTYRTLTNLPPAQRLELHRWFHLPADTFHFTDYGTELYAREVAKYLMGRATSDPTQESVANKH